MTNKLQLKSGERLTLQERQAKIIEVRELMEDGFASVSKISDHFGVARQTAVEWREAALQLIAKDPNGFTREGIRNLQVGRIEKMIERLQEELSRANELKDKLLIHDRISTYYERLARITGLNTDVHMNYQNPQQLVIIKTQDNKGISNTSPSS
jgi:phage shock protein A